MHRSTPTKPRVAITFNPEVGGLAALSINKIMTDFGTNAVNADYRVINPTNENLDEIYTNTEKRQEVFLQAKKKAEEYLKECDGLILSGNRAMVDPRLYGQPLYNEEIDTSRAIAELALVHVAMQRGIPLLGICGGLQILNVYLGGNLKALDRTNLHHEHYLNYNYVYIDPKSELAKIFRKEVSDALIMEKVFESHSQVVGDTGGKNRINNNDDYCKVVATDSRNNIEAVESQYGSPALGVQFHPEVAVNGYANASRLFYQAVEDKVILQNKKIFAAFKIPVETYHHKRLLGCEIHRLSANNKKCEYAQSARINPSININHNLATKIKKTNIPKKIFKHTLGEAVRFFVSKTQTHVISKQIKKKEALCQQMESAKSKYKHVRPAELFKEMETRPVTSLQPIK